MHNHDVYALYEQRVFAISKWCFRKIWGGRTRHTGVGYAVARSLRVSIAQFDV